MPIERPTPFLLVFVIATGLAAGGCARVATVSEIHVDGSFTRTVTYRVNEPAKSPSGDGSVSGGPGVMRFEDVAVLPSGPGWKVSRSMEDATSVISASRNAAPGSVIANDLGLKATESEGAAGTPRLLLANNASITKTGDGKIEYKETLHWNGKLDEELTIPNAKFVAGIKTALPASVRGDTNGINALAVSLQASLWDILFGAPKALFADFLVNQDYATYKFGERMRPVFDKALTNQFGTRLTAVQRAATSEKMLEALMQSASGKTKPDAQSNNNVNLAALFYRVKMPGKIIASNGEVNSYSNEVVWSLYSLGPAAKDITLSATAETH